jgi:hypothetical protein
VGVDGCTSGKRIENWPEEDRDQPGALVPDTGASGAHDLAEAESVGGEGANGPLQEPAEEVVQLVFGTGRVIGVIGGLVVVDTEE